MEGLTAVDLKIYLSEDEMEAVGNVKMEDNLMKVSSLKDMGG